MDFLAFLLDPENLLKVIFKPCGLFLFCEVIFKDPPKIPFKISMKLTFPRLFLPGKVIFALQGKRLKLTPEKIVSGRFSYQLSPVGESVASHQGNGISLCGARAAQVAGHLVGEVHHIRLALIISSIRRKRGVSVRGEFKTCEILDGGKKVL